MRHIARTRRECAREGPEGERARAREIVRCADDVRYWLITFGTIAEARPELAGNGFVKPFIAYPFQLYTLDWLNWVMTQRGAAGDGLIVKARDMGLSNITGSWASHGFLFRSPWQIRVLSRNEGEVDAINDPDSFMWKMELMLMGLPKWLLQSAAPGFDWKLHRKLLQFYNPANKNIISGESTTNTAGRGGRCSAALLDEAAFMRGLEAIWTALRAATMHRFLISTVGLDINDMFYRLHMGKGVSKPSILTIPWDLNPDRDDAWLLEEMQRDTPEGIAREIFMDYFAGTKNLVYPEYGKTEMGSCPYLPNAGPVFVSLHPGRDDHWGIIAVQYIQATGRHRVLTAYQNSGKPLAFYGAMLNGLVLPQFTYTPEDMRFVQFFRQHRRPLFVIDTLGKKVDDMISDPTVGKLASDWGINVNFDIERREHRDRRLMLGQLQPWLDWNQGPDVEDLLDNLRAYRFATDDDGKGRASEQRAPLHTDKSHLPLALETYAINFETLGYMFGGADVKYMGSYSS